LLYYHHSMFVFVGDVFTNLLTARGLSLEESNNFSLFLALQPVSERFTEICAVSHLPS